VIGCAVTVALFSRHRADGRDLIGITRLVTLVLVLVFFPVVGEGRCGAARARHWRAREGRDQPQKQAQDEKPADRISHGWLRFRTDHGPRSASEE